MLLERGRLRAPLRWEAWVTMVGSTPGIVVEPLTLGDVATARSIGALVDPFARLITSTALRLGAPLITADERISASGIVEIVW